VPISPETRIILENMDVSELYDMVRRHVEYTFNPEYPVVASNNKFVDSQREMALVELKRWLYQCMQHSTNHLDDVVADIQPAADTWNCNYLKQLDARRVPGNGLWPDLTQVLRSLRPSEPRDWTAAKKQYLICAGKVFLLPAIQVEQSRGPTHHGWEGRSYEKCFLEAERQNNNILQSSFRPTRYAPARPSRK
jgi:hypothetical protein